MPHSTTKGKQKKTSSGGKSKERYGDQSAGRENTATRLLVGISIRLLLLCSYPVFQASIIGLPTYPSGASVPPPVICLFRGSGVRDVGGIGGVGELGKTSWVERPLNGTLFWSLVEVSD